MIMKNRILATVVLTAGTILGGASLGSAARPGGALKPDQVLIVANADSGPSRELATFYASQREIPKRNIVLVKTPETYMISRANYQEAIRRPIIQAMLERRLDRHIRSICVIWGVPVRIAEAQAATSAPASDTSAFCRAQAKEALLKMAVYYKLLPLVGKSPSKLPAVPINRIENVADLFDVPLPVAPTQAPEARALFEQLRKSVVRRQIKVRFMLDKAARILGERQLMALHREMYGLNGLISYVRDTRITNPPDLAVLRAMLKKAEEGLGRLRRPETPKTLANARARTELLKQSGGFRLVAGLEAGRSETIKKISPRRARGRKHLTKTTASVDSELAMLWRGDYELKGSLSNPLYWKFRGKVEAADSRPAVLMTARIDAPSASLARRIITDSIAVEKTGLKGVFYVDSGLPRRFATAPNNSGYRSYDYRLRTLHGFVAKRTGVKTVLDTSSRLFAPGKCPGAALYAGWYSLRKYVGAFIWKRGAVGWHTASFEAADLRNPKSTQWCPQMLINGVAATVGAVDEPLLTAFPAPDEFYPLLLTGKYTIAECYWRTIPNTSWQMTLIADPLYNPFKTNPQASLQVLPGGLKP